MKTIKRKTNNIIYVLNVIAVILFILPTFKLDLFNENYSTLSLTTRGYLYLLFLGILIGLIFAYETKYIQNSKYAFYMFLFMFIGVMIPHHVPYNLQGNLHLIFAYLGFAGISIITILNCYLKKYRDTYFMFLFIAILIYLKCGMVNTLSEVIVMLSSIYINLICYIKKKN